ncbi:MAG: signal peptidase II [Candidatus Aminicenantes bacterium]|nr:signal peptidase II [Candidatus Aminicenantes bacterium]
MNLNLKKKYIFIIALIVVIDQISKLIIKINFTIYSEVNIITGFFQIRYVKNSGAVWGLFSNTPHSFIPKVITGLSLIALIIVVYYFVKINPSCILELTSLSLITGGALGNNIDRLYQGYVVDFLDFYISKYHWPTFNVADFCISSGVLLLIFSFWRGNCASIK